MPQQSPSLLKIKCPDPQCGKVMAVKRPDKPGKFQISCPACKRKIAFELKPAPQPAPAPAPTPIYDVPDGRAANTSAQGDNGRPTKTTTVIRDDDSYQAFRGKLILLRRGWFNKEFKLNLGQNIIGRRDADPAGNSDIAISDDPSMSRRSIDIHVSFHEFNGYMFELRVLRATNPVLVNREPLMPGETFALNFNDSIILGKTQFRFVQDV